MQKVQVFLWTLLLLGMGVACQAPEQAEETELVSESSELEPDEEAQRANTGQQADDSNTSGEVARDSEVRQPGPREGFEFAEGTSFTLETKQTDEGGWSYLVFMNGKRMIHQLFVPGVQGKQAFSTEEDARKVGELVKNKLENNIMPPSVRISELDSLGITYE